MSGETVNKYANKALRQVKRDELSALFDKILMLLDLEPNSEIKLSKRTRLNSDTLKQILCNIASDLKILLSKDSGIVKKINANKDLQKFLKFLFITSKNKQDIIQSPEISDVETFNYLSLLLALLKYLSNPENMEFINYLTRTLKGSVKEHILVKENESICGVLQQALTVVAEKRYILFEDYENIINEISYTITKPNIPDIDNTENSQTEESSNIGNDSSIVIFPNNRKYNIEFKSENSEVAQPELRHKKNAKPGLFSPRRFLPKPNFKTIFEELKKLHATVSYELENSDNDEHHEQILQDSLQKFVSLKSEIFKQLRSTDEDILLQSGDSYTYFETLDDLKTNENVLRSIEENFIKYLDSCLKVKDLKNFDRQSFKNHVYSVYRSIASLHKMHEKKSKLLSGFVYNIYINDGSYYIHSLKKLFERIDTIENDLPQSTFREKLYYIKELDDLFTSSADDAYFEIFSSIILPVKDNITESIRPQITAIEENCKHLYSEFFDNKKEGSIGLFDTYLQERNKHYFFKDIIVKIFDCFLKCIYMTIFNTVFFADYSEREIYLMELQTKAKKALISNPHNETAMEELKAHIEKGKSFSSKRQNSLSNLLTQLENRLNKIEDPLHAESENQVEKEDGEEIIRNLNM